VHTVRYEFGFELNLIENNLLSYNVRQALIAGTGHQIIPEFNVIHIPFNIPKNTDLTQQTAQLVINNLLPFKMSLVYASAFIRSSSGRLSPKE